MMAVVALDFISTASIYRKDDFLPAPPAPISLRGVPVVTADGCCNRSGEENAEIKKEDEEGGVNTFACQRSACVRNEADRQSEAR